MFFFESVHNLFHLKSFFVRMKCLISIFSFIPLFFLLYSLTITVMMVFVCHIYTEKSPLCLVSRITIVTWFKSKWYEKEICVGLVYWITTPFFTSLIMNTISHMASRAVIKASSVSGWSFPQKKNFCNMWKVFLFQSSKAILISFQANEFCPQRIPTFKAVLNGIQLWKISFFVKYPIKSNSVLYLIFWNWNNFHTVMSFNWCFDMSVRHSN